MTAGEARFTGIIFDFFNTLVEYDSRTPTPAQILVNLGYDCPTELEEIWSSAGFNSMETPTGTDYISWRKNNMLQLVKYAGVPPGLHQSVVTTILEMDRAWTVRARPGAISLLESLKSSGKRTAICSNWDYNLEKYLLQANLSGFFEAVVTSAEVGARKPHPRPFAEVTRLLGLAPQNCIFIGDDWMCDIVGALRFGMHPVWFADSGELRLPNLVRQIKSLEEISDFIT